MMHPLEWAWPVRSKMQGVCQKDLRDMGVDLGVWIRAMETPMDQLHYSKVTELLSLKLATSAEASRPPLATKG